MAQVFISYSRKDKDFVLNNLLPGARQGDKSAASEKIGWEFFRDVPSSVSFDLLSETIPLIQTF